MSFVRIALFIPYMLFRMIIGQAGLHRLLHGYWPGWTPEVLLQTLRFCHCRPRARARLR